MAMLQKKRTVPDLSINSPDHQAAIASGNEQYTAWQYNVADHFKGNSVAEIRQALKDNAHPFAVAMENWTSDFNFSSLVRNANGFNAKEVFYIGDKKVDRRGMTGTHNYTDVKWIETIEDFLSLKNDYVFVAIDNVPGSVSLIEYNWAPNSLMIFGSEGTGLTKEMISYCKDIVHIPMMGSVRRFNAACSSAIVMYDYISKI